MTPAYAQRHGGDFIESKSIDEAEVAEDVEDWSPGVCLGANVAADEVKAVDCSSLSDVRN